MYLSKSNVKLKTEINRPSFFITKVYRLEKCFNTVHIHIKNEHFEEM